MPRINKKCIIKICNAPFQGTDVLELKTYIKTIFHFLLSVYLILNNFSYNTWPLATWAFYLCYPIS